eukprot:PhM_4_TR1327/c5_g1_i2/m.101127/K00931/proB; glutamate 5-kinase
MKPRQVKSDRLSSTHIHKLLFLDTTTATQIMTFNHNIIVIKIGSNSLVDGEGKLDVPYLQSIASQVVKLRDDLGLTPVIVSSGATTLGMTKMNMKAKPVSLGERHALPAIGQIGLMAKWEEAFAAHGVNIAQLLLTHDDFSNRERHAN